MPGETKKKINFAESAYNSFVIWGILASLSTTICTIVDSLLVGNLAGSDGLAVVNIATPVYLFYALCGVTIGIGANVKIGRLLGESKEEEANKVFKSQLTIGLILALICLTPLLFKDTYYSFLGVTPELYDLADRYLRIVLWTAPVFVMYHILAASVKTDGNPRIAAISSAVVIGFNVSLDFLFMKGLNMGVLGASASLCTAEVLGTIILLSHFFFKKHRMLKLGLTKPSVKDFGRFVWDGFSTGSAFIFSAIVMLSFNNLLFNFEGAKGTLCVAIYGVLYTVSTIPSGIFEGTSNALATVTPFLVGESDREGIMFIKKRAVFVSVISGGVIALICVLLPKIIVGFFGLDDDSSSLALRIFALCFVFMGINTVMTSFWQSIGRTKLANALSTLRNFVLLLLSGTIIIPMLDIKGVALAYLISEGLCSLFVFVTETISSSDKYVEKNYSLHEKCFESDYPIEQESMGKISADIERICDEWEIGIKQAFLVNFICEEILLNIMKFALEGKDEKRKYYISLKLIAKGEDYILCVRDNISLYNPFESKGDEVDNGVLNVIKKKAKTCEYQRKLIFNYLYIVV